jgi:N-acetylglucosaminyl-diphospho-decaprenol L-rhamnosyltransferase
VIDAVVVTADSREMALRCLERLNDPLIERIIVVDNASRDGTGAAVATRHPEATLVRLDKGEGLASAYNRGAERGVAELVLFLNDDVLAYPGSIAKLARVLEANSGAVAAAGRLVDPESGDTQPEYLPKQFPTVATFLASFAALDRLWPSNPWTGRRGRSLDDQKTIAVDQPPGACLLVRRPVFEAIRGWDQTFSFWFEDVDLARRLRSHGRVLYVPSAPFGHVGGWSARRLSRAQVVDRSYHGALHYGEKHFSRAQRVALGLLFAFVGALRSAQLARSNPELARTYRAVLRSALALTRGRPLPAS